MLLNNSDELLMRASQRVMEECNEEAELIATKAIEQLANQDAAMAYLLRSKIRERLGKVNMALDDVSMAASLSLFDLHVLTMLFPLVQRRVDGAQALLKRLTYFWLYSRPQDSKHPALLNAIALLEDSCFGYVERQHRELVGWVVSNAPPTLIVETKHSRFQHIPQYSPRKLSFNENNHAYEFSITLPEGFDYCRIGIEGHRSLWGSPLTEPKEVSRETVGFAPAQSTKNFSDKVSILIPVYQGFSETKACLQSVYASCKQNKTKIHILVIDDKSPDISLKNWLKKEAQRGAIELISREFNVGFVGAVNTGLALIPADNHVILLNADTLVAHNWIDRLHQLAISDSTIGTVTPLSNNAELLSYPQAMRANPSPTLAQTMQLDQLFSSVGGLFSQEIPTGVGFCLYIRSDLRSHQPFLNETLIQRGYGEETEFCLKAAKHGWKNSVAANVFVAHCGGISFGQEKQLFSRHHIKQIHARFPQHSTQYDDFLRKKPFNTLFNQVQKQWLQQTKPYFSTLYVLGHLPIRQEKKQDKILYLIISTVPSLSYRLIFNEYVGLNEIIYNAHETECLLQDLNDLSIATLVIDSEITFTQGGFVSQLHNAFFNLPCETLPTQS